MTASESRTIAQYRLLHKLGEGGMGEVFVADDTRLRRKVAIKTLNRAGGQASESMARLLREARAAAAVSHPHVAHVYEIGEASDGTPFIAMELVEGRPLDVVLRRGPLPVEEAVRSAEQIAEALAAAHEQGVVHRDIKPSNVVLTRLGVKVLDFGIALLGSAGVEASDDQPTLARTREGALVGTVPYMSPEQARGMAVDHRSDVFSLGVVLYEMLTGVRPFGGATETEVLGNILHREADTPSTRRQGLSPALDRVVQRCLEKEPALRFGSAAQLAEALHSVGAPTGGESEPVRGMDTPPSRSRWRRLILPAALAGSVALALLLWRTGDLDGGGSSGGAAIRRLAVLPLLDVSGGVGGNGAAAEGDFLADGLTEELINRLSAIDSLRVISRASAFRYKDRQEDLAAIARDLDADALLTGRLRRQGDDVQVSVELTAGADQLWGERFRHRFDDLYSLQADMATVIAGRLRLRLSPEQAQRLERRGTESAEAHELYLKGLYQWHRASSDSMESAIALFQRAIDLDPGYALAYAGLASAEGVPLGDVLSGERALGAGRAAARRAIELDPSLAEAYIALASIDFWFGWNPAAAERGFQRALELDPSSAIAHHQLGWTLALIGRLEESRSHFEQALELDPVSLVVALDRNVPEMLSGRHEEALSWIQKARQLDPGFFMTYSVEGYDRLLTGQVDQAVGVLEKALSLDRSPMAVAWLGYARGRRGELDEARRLLAELTRGGDPESQHSGLLEALIHVGLGDTDNAFAALERGIERRDGWMAWLPVEPLLLPALGSDPRWPALLQRFRAAAER